MSHCPRDVAPQLVAHADWSVDPRKRWVCRAARDEEGTYRVGSPTPVGRLGDFFPSLSQDLNGAGSILAGFDFPLGLPAAYAERVAIEDFVAALKSFGRGRWRAFYEVAETAGEISLKRPFFPARPGRKGEFSRAQLADGLGVGHFNDLLRRVDRPTGERPAASVMFWTLGGKQVGKATITGWRDLLVPALNTSDLDVALWPFEGSLVDCLARAQITVVEAYPAEYYRHLKLPLVRGGSKRRQQSRIENGATLIAWARSTGIKLARSLRRDLASGFGARPDGEDPFDAVVGTFGLLNVVLGLRPSYDPIEPELRAVEGWTLGASTLS